MVDDLVENILRVFAALQPRQDHAALYLLDAGAVRRHGEERHLGVERFTIARVTVPIHLRLVGRLDAIVLLGQNGDQVVEELGYPLLSNGRQVGARGVLQ